MTWFPIHVLAFVVILSAAKDLVLTFAVPRLPFTPFGFVVILRSAAIEGSGFVFVIRKS